MYCIFDEWDNEQGQYHSKPWSLLIFKDIKYVRGSLVPKICKPHIQMTFKIIKEMTGVNILDIPSEPVCFICYFVARQRERKQCIKCFCKRQIEMEIKIPNSLHFLWCHLPNASVAYGDSGNCGTISPFVTLTGRN